MSWWSNSAQRAQDVFRKPDNGITFRKRSNRRKTALKSKHPNASKEMQIPVMMRGNIYNVPLQEPIRSKTRRRTYMSLDVPGAEIKLPALPQMKIGWRLFSGTVALGLLAIFYFAWNSPILVVNSVDFSGLQRLSLTDIPILTEMIGKQVFMVYPSKLEKQILEAYPEFVDVDVKVQLPNIVSITVEERVPILIWQQDQKSLLVDANGYAFPLRNENHSKPTLIVEALSPPPTYSDLQEEMRQTQFLPVEMVSALISLKAIAPSDSPLVYDEKHGFGWKEKKGWEIYFGDMNDIDVKLDIYKVLIKQIKQEKILPEIISVEYVNAPYYRLEH